MKVQLRGLGVSMDESQIGRLLQNPDGIAELLQESHPGTGESPAEIFADVVNVMRLDVARMARAQGVEVDCPRMTDDRAAQLLAGVIDGEGVEIVRMFNAEEDRRSQVLDAMLDDDEHEEFRENKQASLYTGGD